MLLYVGLAVGAAPSTPFMLNAKGDSCANPTAGGWNLNTEYTFFKNVSPTTHWGSPGPNGGMGMNAPRHIELFPFNAPALKSAGEISHCGPPNDMLTVTFVLHGNVQCPLSFPTPIFEPGIRLYICAMSSDGPWTKVVPVSIAARFVAFVTATELFWTVSAGVRWRLEIYINSAIVTDAQVKV